MDVTVAETLAQRSCTGLTEKNATLWKQIRYFWYQDQNQDVSYHSQHILTGAQGCYCLFKVTFKQQEKTAQNCASVAYSSSLGASLWCVVCWDARTTRHQLPFSQTREAEEWKVSTLLTLGQALQPGAASEESLTDEIVIHKKGLLENMRLLPFQSTQLYSVKQKTHFLWSALLCPAS